MKFDPLNAPKVDTILFWPSSKPAYSQYYTVVDSDDYPMVGELLVRDARGNVIQISGEVLMPLNPLGLLAYLASVNQDKAEITTDDVEHWAFQDGWNDLMETLQYDSSRPLIGSVVNFNDEDLSPNGYTVVAIEEFVLNGSITVRDEFNRTLSKSTELMETLVVPDAALAAQHLLQSLEIKNQASIDNVEQWAYQNGWNQALTAITQAFLKHNR